MGKVKELVPAPPSIGSLAERIIKRMNPEGYIEFQLRQAVTDAVREVGKERMLEIVREAAE